MKKRVLALMLLAVMALSLSACGKGPDLQKMYDDYCTSIWSDIASDGSYLTIDTDPYDSSGRLEYSDAYYAIIAVNKALGLPDSLLDDMGDTTASDGKQSRVFKDAGVTVNWAYSNYRGFEVTYHKNK